MRNEWIPTPIAPDISDDSNRLLHEIERLIEQTGRNVAVYLNATISRLYWSIGNYIVTGIQYETYSEYEQEILATLSQRLTEKF
jgi:predicted nucleic acid-binding Zn finger protein